MKEKMLKIRIAENLKKKLYDLNISEMLTFGKLDVGQNAGQYSSIIACLQKGEEIDYAREIEKVEELSSLTEHADKWIKHLKTYVGKL